MEFKHHEKKWGDFLEKLFLSLNKKVYVIILIISLITLISLSVVYAIQGPYSIMILVISISTFLAIVIGILIFIITKIESRLWGNIVYYIIIILFDIVIMYQYIYSSMIKDIQMATRMYYFYVGYMNMLVNIKKDHTKTEFLCLIIYKFILYIVIMIFYDYFQNESQFLLIDIFIMLLSSILVILSMLNKNILYTGLEKLNNKNVAITNQIRNIFNTVKSPMMSINFKKNTIFLNVAFINFFKENFDMNRIDIKYLLNEKNENPFLNLDLKSFIKTEELLNFESLYHYIESDKKNKKIGTFKNKILLLNQLLKSFSQESDSPSEFNLLDLLNLKKDFEDKGTFRLVNTDKIVEIYWKSTVHLRDEEVFEIMLQDITSLRQLQFTKADIKYRHIYLARIAHEFKTPISSLIYSLKDLVKILKKSERNNEGSYSDIAKSISFIEGQANFISILIHDINDYCKNISEFEINLDRVNLREIINFSIQILNTLINRDINKKENVKVKLLISDDVPKFITTDERRLKQLIVNLLSNSLKFTNFGHISLNVEYSPKIDLNSYDEIKFFVEDTGVGITKEDQKKLFQDYAEINKDFIKLNKEGTGLGLSICKHIINKLGKDLYCISQDRVTKFFFTIYDLSDNYENNLDKPSKDIESIKLINKASSEMISKSRKSKENFVILEKNPSSIFNKSFDFIKMTHSERIFHEIYKFEEFDNHKVKLFNFIKPLIKYMKNIIENVKDLKFILVVDDEKINSKSLKQLIKKYLTKYNFSNYKILILNDGIEALNILYFDAMFFMKISSIFCDLNMKFLNGDILFNLLKNVNKNTNHVLKFIMYSNTDIDTILAIIPEIKYILRKPCSRIELEKIVDQIEGF